MTQKQRDWMAKNKLVGTWVEPTKRDAFAEACERAGTTMSAVLRDAIDIMLEKGDESSLESAGGVPEKRSPVRT